MKSKEGKHKSIYTFTLRISPKGQVYETKEMIVQSKVDFDLKLSFSKFGEYI